MSLLVKAYGGIDAPHGRVTGGHGITDRTNGVRPGLWWSRLAWGRGLHIGERCRLIDEMVGNHDAGWLVCDHTEIDIDLDFVADPPLRFTTRRDFDGAMDDPWCPWSEWPIRRECIHGSSLAHASPPLRG
jgi:hypothetical protein